MAHAVGCDIHAGPADIAGGIHGGDGHTGGFNCLAGAGKIILHRTRLGVIALQHLSRVAVSCHGDGGQGQDAVHSIRDLNVDSPVLLIQSGRHSRRRAVHRAGEGGGDLVNIDRTGAGGIGVGHLNMVPSGVRSGGSVNDHAAQSEVLGQRHVDLLPASEVQRGDGQLQVALDVTGVEERELVAGAVAVDPEVQGCVGRSQSGEGACHGLRIVAGVLREHIVQLSGVMASLDMIADVGAGDCQIVAAEEARIRSFKVLNGLQGHLSHRDGNGQALVPGGDRQVPSARGGGSEYAALIHCADVPADRPCKCLGIRPQRQVVPDRSGGQGCFAAGGHGKLRQVGGTVFQGQSIRVADGMDHGTARGPPAGGRYSDVTAGGGSGQIVAASLLCNGARTGGKVIAGVHGDVIAVHAGGCDGHGAAGQHIVTGGVDVKMIQPPTGMVRGYQENLVGDLAVGLGRSVDNGRRGGIRRGHRQIGGAAAVQTQDRLAAQFQQPLPHLRQRRTNGIAGLAAVDGVKDQGAVRLLAHGSAGIAPGGQFRDHGTVFRQTVESADGVLHVLPAAVGGDGKGHLTADRQVPQGVGVVGVRVGVGGEDDLIRLDSGDSGLLHPVHPGGDGRADGQLSLFNGADRVDAGFRGAGGVLGVEIVCIEEQAAVGAGLVHRRHGADQLCGAAGAVIYGITQICGDLDAGFA